VPEGVKLAVGVLEGVRDPVGVPVEVGEAPSENDAVCSAGRGVGWGELVSLATVLAGWRRADCTGRLMLVTRSRPHPRGRQWEAVERVACLAAAARGLYGAVECHSCG